MPAASVAVHVTVVVTSIGNLVPEGGSQNILMSPPTSSCVTVVPSSSSVAVPSTLSSTVTVNVTTAPSVLVASRVMSSGTAMVGGVVSSSSGVGVGVGVDITSSSSRISALSPNCSARLASLWS